MSKSTEQLSRNEVLVEFGRKIAALTANIEFAEGNAGGEENKMLRETAKHLQAAFNLMWEYAGDQLETTMDGNADFDWVEELRCDPSDTGKGNPQPVNKHRPASGKEVRRAKQVV